MIAYRRCYVSGRVQGVFFRASTHEKATELGVSARATNLADGRVEVLVRGEEAKVDALAQWLREGPPLARVDEVRCVKLDVEEMPGL